MWGEASLTPRPRLLRGNNVYYAWLRTVSATGVAPLARGTARASILDHAQIPPVLPVVVCLSLLRYRHRWRATRQVRRVVLGRERMWKIGTLAHLQGLGFVVRVVGASGKWRHARCTHSAEPSVIDIISPYEGQWQVPFGLIRPRSPAPGRVGPKWENNVYCAWLRTVSATGVAPLARGTARATSPTPASPLPPSPPLFHSSAPSALLHLY